MKALLLTLAIAASLLSAFGQEKFTIAEKSTIHSSILNEDRELWIGVPENYQYGGNFPVLYLLDGATYIHSVTGMIRELGTYNKRCPEMIVVGICNTNRTRDLSPFKGGTTHPYVTEELNSDAGGNEEFIKFLESELIPHIDSTYRTTTYKTLIGHSFGGLTVLNVATNHTKLFNSYIALDPSVWWGNEQIRLDIKKKGLDLDKNQSLYVAIANNITTDEKPAELIKDQSNIVMLVGASLRLDDYLKKKGTTNYSSKYYPSDTHGSVTITGTHDGLRHIFDFYPFKTPTVELWDANIDLVKKASTHFAKVSETMGYKVIPGPWRMNSIAYQLINLKQLERARKVLEYNATLYPKFWNCYDSLGELQEKMGNIDEAIKNYKKATMLNPDGPSKQKWKDLL